MWENNKLRNESEAPSGTPKNFPVLASHILLDDFDEWDKKEDRPTFGYGENASYKFSLHANVEAPNMARIR